MRRMSFSEEVRATTRMLATFTLVIGFLVAILSQLADSTVASSAGRTIGVSVITVGLLLRFESVLRVGEPVRVASGGASERDAARTGPRTRSAGGLSMLAGLVVELFGVSDHPRALLVGVLFVLVGAALRIEALVTERLRG